MFKEAESSQGSATAVKEGIVQNQDYRFVGILFQEEMLQEADEGSTVLGLGSDPGDGVAQPIVGADGMMPDLLAWCGYPLLLTAFHPGGSQG